MIKKLINWLVFTGSMFYGLWTFWLLLGALFVLGDNDTFPEVLGILAAGLCAIPASLLALRHRRLAALSFTTAAALWVIGVIDGELYLARKFGHHIVPLDIFCSLLKTTSVPLFLTFFYALTDWLRWPLLWPRAPQTSNNLQPRI